MTKKMTPDEKELLEFAAETARQVQTWPSWKREGWAVIDAKRTHTRELDPRDSTIDEKRHMSSNGSGGNGTRFDQLMIAIGLVNQS